MLTLTVLFENPFWVGILERQDHNQIEVARVVFGSEPTAPEVMLWLLEGFYRLEYAVATNNTTLRPSTNPKRQLRQARASQSRSVSKAQEVLRLEQEQHKLERKTTTKAIREAEAERKFLLRRAKQKAKHRGH